MCQEATPSRHHVSHVALPANPNTPALEAVRLRLLAPATEAGAMYVEVEEQHLTNLRNGSVSVTYSISVQTGSFDEIASVKHERSLEKAERLALADLQGFLTQETGR